MSALERAKAVADAVLYEGYLLYPYSAGALKNQMRWQFGVLMPPGYADASEPSAMQTQVLAQGEPDTRIAILVRFMQIRERRGDAGTYQEALEREIALDAVLREERTEHRFAFEPERDGERTTQRIAGTCSRAVERDGAYFRVTLRVENASETPPDADRTAALRTALVGTHALFTAEKGARFISLLDPPAEAAAAVARCKNRRVFPVLTGEAADAHTASMALASPIVLYDFPQIAAQSSGHTFDAAEIDELLLLSVAALSEDEKREARATDARARAIVDRAEAMNAGVQRALHGRIAPAAAGDEAVEIAGVTVRAGSHVRVRPKRRADAFDLFADGMTARVRGVHSDVDGRRYVAVVFDGDPAAELHEWYGRSFFYDPDEVEPVSSG